jgi:thiol-disulfide isomerase/thioredoxin
MPFGQSACKALEILAKDHATDRRAAAMAMFLTLAPVEADQFLRALMEKNPDRAVQARACLALAHRAKWRADVARVNSTLARPADNEEERNKFEQMREQFKVDAERLDKEADQYFDLVARKYGDFARPEKPALRDDAAKLLEASRSPDWQAFDALASTLEQQLAQKGKDADELAKSLLVRKADLVTSADVIAVLDELSRKDRSVEAAALLVRIAAARRTVHSFKRGHVIVGKLAVADGKLDPSLVMAQTPILPGGYFAGEVADLQRPVGFRAHGYDNLDLSLAGNAGDMVYVGQVTLKPLPRDRAASLKGKITLDGAKKGETAEVTLSMSVSGINTPHNGFSPRARWPDALQVPVNDNGEFRVTGLSPATYYLQIKAKDHVDLGREVTFMPGKELDAGACRLQCTDIGFYIGGAPPRSDELKCEKDYATALRRAQAEKKPMLIMMTATWCGWCKVLEKETLSDPWIRHFLAGFVVVKAYEDPAIEKRYGQSGYPTLVFTDPGGKAVHTIVGHKPRLTFASDCARACRRLDLQLPRALQTLIDRKVIANE